MKNLKSQSDLIVIKEKDYIRNPKPNGYRSYHIVLGVSVCYLDCREYYPVESADPHAGDGFLGQYGAPDLLQAGTGRQGRGSADSDPVRGDSGRDGSGF